MLPYPPITILVCTYNRPNELTRVLEAFSDNLIYNGPVEYLICDDSSPDNYRAKLESTRVWQLLQPRFVSTDKNSGWGANVNNGLLNVTTEFTFFLEDDYLLTQPLNLNISVAVMLRKPDLGMIRYRGTSGDMPIYHQFEADIAEWQPNYRQGLGLLGRVSYLQFDSGSPTTYVYSHGPHLKHRRFHAFYGLYPTGLKLGHTEESYAHMVKDRMTMLDAPAIAILPEWVPMWFDHIGESYQLTELDK